MTTKKFAQELHFKYFSGSHKDKAVLLPVILEIVNDYQTKLNGIDHSFMRFKHEYRDTVIEVDLEHGEQPKTDITDMLIERKRVYESKKNKRIYVKRKPKSIKLVKKVGNG